MDFAFVNFFLLLGTVLAILFLNHTVSTTAKNVETILDKMDKE